MKRIIAFILLLSMALLLLACAPTGQVITDVEAFEKQVTADWIQQTGQEKDFTLGTFHYYGTAKGYHIIFFTGQVVMPMMSEKTIADSTFSYNCIFRLYAYRNNRFIDLEEAYEKGLISKEAIAKAAELHQAEKEKAFEQQKIQEIFEDRYGEIRSFNFYAEEKGRYIIFVQMKGRPQVYTVKKIAGSEFRYREEFFLYAYVDGEFIDLEEAYNNGLVSKETVAEAVRVHKKDANVPD